MVEQHTQQSQKLPSEDMEVQPLLPAPALIPEWQTSNAAHC